MSRRSRIGFDRRINLEWLDAIATRVAADASPGEVRAHVWSLLAGVVTGEKPNTARGKTVTVLNHIWCEVPENARPLRSRAIRQLDTATADERLALHWAMMVGTYPIFTDVAAGAGRLLTLQGSFSLAQLTRRLIGVWGERSTLVRATQRIIRSMIQWGVLQDTELRGMYEGIEKKRWVGEKVAAVLVEAVLVDAEEAALPVDQLTGHSTLFPFRLALNSNHLRSARQFQVHRQGLDRDFVELRRGV